MSLNDQLIYADNASLNAWRHGGNDLVTAVEVLSQKTQGADHHRLANLAIVKTRLKQWSLAEQDARASIQVQPTILAHIALSIAIGGQGDLTSAKQEFNQVFLRREPKNDCLLLLIKSIMILVAGGHGEAMRRVKDLVDACEDADEPLCRAVQAHMHLLIGQTALEEQDYEESLGSYARASALAPFSNVPELETISLIFGWNFGSLLLVIRQWTCETLYAASRMREAAQSLRTMLNEFGTEISASIEFSDWLQDFRRRCIESLQVSGDAAVGTGKHDEAVVDYSAALSLDPPSRADLVVKRNKARLALGALDDAMEDSDEIRETLSGDAQVNEAMNVPQGSGSNSREDGSANREMGIDDTEEMLTPTTDGIFEDVPRLRILVIGKSGVGKSSLVRAVFGIDIAYSSDFERGITDIEKGLQSPVNERFILHDSLGFEAADNVNYDTVKEFIRRRRACAPKDRLHAVWFCVPVPQAGSRLLEAEAEDFFKTREETMGATSPHRARIPKIASRPARPVLPHIPIIVVYTKADKFINDWLLKSAASHQQLDGNDLLELAFSEVKSHVKEKHEEINHFAGEPLPYAVVSTKEKYRYTLQQLVKLTFSQIGAHGTPYARIPSGIALIAAQRIDPNLKIKGTIDVARQKYWIALGASPVFTGNTIWDCLSLIHTDIVAIWNFNDPACHLSDKNFKELVAKMAVKVGTHSVSKPTQEFLASIRSSLMAAILGTLGTIANPAASIVLPVVEDLAPTMWLYGIYDESVENVQELFIPYIVDLTHILEMLAILTARGHKKLTRRIIKLAYHAYHSSDVMIQAHSDIQKYRELDGRDAALEMIENLIDPERYGDASLRNYYTEISKLDLTRFHLDQEEDW